MKNYYSNIRMATMKNNNISLSYKTKGNSNPRGKSKVYFSYHPDDIIHLDHTAELLQDKHDCAVYYYDYANGEPNLEELSQLLDEMQLFVIPITSNFLFRSNIAFDFELKYAMKKAIPVLPLLQNSDLGDQFNERCGNLQYLDEFSTDKTAVSFDEKLEKYLLTVLISPEMIKKIQDAFDTYVFLSYRKKDRAYAQSLMKLIHKNDLCRDIAIWYDEFLVAGEPFDKAIEAALAKSELFALLVTPNLINEDNYVMTTEFPLARDSGKSLLAAESCPTDKNLLKEKFKGIPECVDANDEIVLPEELLERLKHIAIRQNDSPEHNFLIGLAYLSGIDVERNNDMALKLIEGAAEEGLLAAMKKLSDMYYSGSSVTRDIYSAAEWQQRYVSKYEEIYLETHDDEDAIEIFWARNTLANYYVEAALIDNAERTYLDNISWIEMLAKKNPELYNGDLAGSYNNAGVFYKNQGQPERAEYYYQKAIALYEELAKNNPDRSRRPSGLRKTTPTANSLAHRTTWLRSDLEFSIKIKDNLNERSTITKRL